MISVPPDQQFSNFSVHQNMVDFLKHRFLAFTPGTCDSVGLSWCLGICICNKLLGTAGAAGLGTILENHSFRCMLIEKLTQVLSALALSSFH